ncbi:uncharacterized protein LOC129938409 [Eupeodes corollae]|uniref:uncharacterized protein LOC129938409 n=1 Tax=Eupeodes corollae TaxID=290404 RepID=UPI002490AB6D|nr:uncharacterized protein LOC129938409 [Eupeodes corollae]
MSDFSVSDLDSEYLPSCEEENDDFSSPIIDNFEPLCIETAGPSTDYNSNSNTPGESPILQNETAVNSDTQSHAEILTSTQESLHSEQNEQLKGKKRSRNVKSWKVNERKVKRNTGQKYITAKGVTVPKKKFIKI